MSNPEGFFVDWDGNVRSTVDPGGGYLCETDTVARYVERMLGMGMGMGSSAAKPG